MRAAVRPYKCTVTPGCARANLSLPIKLRKCTLDDCLRVEAALPAAAVLQLELWTPPLGALWL
jgi:hypothetical protein